jgi:hypothetical protein
VPLPTVPVRHPFVSARRSSVSADDPHVPTTCPTVHQRRMRDPVNDPLRQAIALLRCASGPHRSTTWPRGPTNLPRGSGDGPHDSATPPFVLRRQPLVPIARAHHPATSASASAGRPHGTTTPIPVSVACPQRQKTTRATPRISTQVQPGGKYENHRNSRAHHTQPRARVH